jgi:hypothetical protein
MEKGPLEIQGKLTRNARNFSLRLATISSEVYIKHIKRHLLSPAQAV